MSHSRPQDIRFAYFGSTDVSSYVLKELEERGLRPSLIVSSAKDPLPLEKLRQLDADLFVIASFGKILPTEVIYMPKHKSLNIHPSLLPRLRGTSPIKSTILLGETPGVTIIRMDEKMDHGPIVGQRTIDIGGIPKHEELEKVLWEEGGKLLADILPGWINSEIMEVPQDESLATYTSKITKEDGLLDLGADVEKNLRKVRAYSTWPGAYIFFKKKSGQEIRIVIKDAEIKEGAFVPTRVIPEGKREMDWQDFLRGNS